MLQLGLQPFEFYSLWVVFDIAFRFGLRFTSSGPNYEKDKGDSKMLEVWNAIRQGADAYLGSAIRDDFTVDCGSGGSAVPVRLCCSAER